MIRYKINELVITPSETGEWVKAEDAEKEIGELKEKLRIAEYWLGVWKDISKNQDSDILHLKCAQRTSHL